MPQKNQQLSTQPYGRSRLLPELKEWQDRLFEVDAEAQVMLNEFYRQEHHKEAFRYQDGDPVLSLSQGHYHQGQIHQYYRTAVPKSIFPAKIKRSDVVEDDLIPTVILSFSGWGTQYNEEVPENELISRVPSEVCHVQGLLVAHEWNTFARVKLGLTEKEMGKSVWYLEDHLYAMLEKMWKKETGRISGFAAYCGRTVMGVPEVDEASLTSEAGGS